MKNKWSPQRRALQAASWTPERRAKIARLRSEGWRARNPEKAVIRDRLIASEKQQPCICGNAESVLLVTDYPTAAFVWRCRECAAKWRAEQ